MLNQPETFPIDIPAGVIIEPLNSTPVVVWTTAGTPPPALFDIQPTGSGTQTTIRGITFVGGQTGIRFEGQTGDTFRLRGEGLRWAWNQIGLQAAALNGESIDLDLVDCQVRDDTTSVTPGPTLQAPQIGLQFHVAEANEGEIPRIEVRLENLRTSGIFPTMDPTAFPGDTDLGAAGTRLVEVWVGEGITDEYQLAGSNWQRMPVASVILEAIGGLWDGGPDAYNPGWDVGLYANFTDGTAVSDQEDYTGAYEITMSGVTVRRFRLAGVHAGTRTYKRGQLLLDANSVVRGSGFGAGSGAGNGVHLYEFEGYLGFHASAASLLDNLGSGLYANAAITMENGRKFPMGLFLDLRDSDVHGNGRHGLELRCALDGLAGGQGAIVGGTWDWVQNGAKGLLVVGNEPVATLDPDLGYGPGSVNRCRISNNGKAGIHVQELGTSGPDDSTFSVADLRVVNSYIWNNPEGGIHGVLDSPADGNGPCYLVPVLHSTLAGNGDAVGWNLEIEESQATHATEGLYRWLPQVSPSGTLVETKLRESLLQRKVPTDPDLGGYLVGVLGVEDLANPSAVGADQVGIAGVRSQNLPSVGVFPKSTTLPAPFSSTQPNWGVRDPLGAGLEILPGGASVFYLSPNFLHTFEEEAGLDYSWSPRPS
ncbi:MAG: hypothetical protein D6795_02820, partial [Deltaproteobacteria bacterium]